MKSFRKTVALISLIVSANFVLHAEVKPNSLFSDNAVLQRNQRVPVWGAATNGERVSVQFAGQRVSAVTKDGKWRVWLKPLEAGGPFTMTIAGDNDTITLTNILVGGTIAWDLDDAMHINKNKDNGWPDIHKTLFKKWGFFNSLADEIGHPEDARLRPWYFTWSLMSRSFPPGCHTVKTSATLIPGLRTLAATIGKDLSTVLVNDSDMPRNLHVTVPGIQPLPQLNRYNYFPNDTLVDQDGYPLPKEALKDANLSTGLSINLPARSVVILTSIN